MRSLRWALRWYYRSTLSSAPTAGIAILGILCVLVELSRWQDDRGSLRAVAKTAVRAFTLVLVGIYISVVNQSVAYAFLVLSILQSHKQLRDLITPYYKCVRT